MVQQLGDVMELTVQVSEQLAGKGFDLLELCFGRAENVAGTMMKIK
jgi:hypothetical protein